MLDDTKKVYLAKRLLCFYLTIYANPLHHHLGFLIVIVHGLTKVISKIEPVGLFQPKAY